MGTVMAFAGAKACMVRSWQEVMMGKQQNRRYLLYGFLFSAAAVIATACAAGPSHFRRSYDIEYLFEDHQVVADYRYYVSGGTYKPLAIVGLRKDYRLDSPHWQEVDADPEKMVDWMLRMRNQPGAEYNIEPNGARILDNQGNPIGIWYSVWDFPRLTFTSEKVIDISLPMPVFPPSNRNPEEDDFIGIRPFPF
jgi:hypothetical protein